MPKPLTTDDYRKRCKARLLDIVAELAAADPGRGRRKRKLAPSKLPKMMSDFVTAIRLADLMCHVEQSPPSIIIFLSLLSTFSDFFVKYVLKVPFQSLRRLDVLLMREDIAQQDIRLKLSRQFVHPNMLALLENREADESAIRMQLQLRNEIMKPPETEDELDFIGDADLESMMTVDEACKIIQEAERIYQALARFSHLRDVRQKALDIRSTGEVKIDPDRAVIKIQAITRGMIARKKVAAMREAEHFRLGISTSAFLKSIADHLQPADYQNTLLRVPIIDEHLPTPGTTLAEVDRLIREHYYTPDPLVLVEARSEPARMDALSEHIFSELVLAEAVQLHSEDAPRLDGLISTVAVIRARSKTSHYDLRTFLYAAVVIPHALSAWKQFKTKRFRVLLVGDRGSGKSAWSTAMQEKLAAPRIRVSKKLFAKKIVSRKQLAESILQFTKTEKYSYVEFDRLEMFGADKGNRTPIKSQILRVLRELSAVDNCQLVGLSRTADIMPEVLAMFDYVVRIRNPVGVDRLSLISNTLGKTYAREELKRVPKRLMEISRSTRRLPIGATIEKLTTKFGNIK